MSLEWIRPVCFGSITALAAVFACTLDTGGLGEGAPPVAKSEVADVAGEAACEWFYTCNCDDIDPNPYTSEEQCAAEVGGDVQAAVDEGDAAGLDYDAQCAGDLIQMLEDLGCDTGTQLNTGEWVDFSARLDCKLFYGDRSPGESCDGLDLSTGDSCERTAHCDNGTCVEIDVAPAPDESCELPELCSGGAYCIDVEGGGDFACELLPGDGETCLGSGDICGQGLSCNQTLKRCDPAPTAGEPCSQTPFACAEGLYCNAVEKCAALPPLGEPCLTQPGPQCAVGLQCEADVCVREDPLVCWLGPAIFQIRF